MVELLEKWGNLPEGSSELVKNEELKNATKLELTRFAEELAEEVAKEHILRETQLDLSSIRWPTKVSILSSERSREVKYLVSDLPAVIDRMGRLFFRIQDVSEDWFVPGYTIQRHVQSKETGTMAFLTETILEATFLFVGEQKIAIQVTTCPA